MAFSEHPEEPMVNTDDSKFAPPLPSTVSSRWILFGSLALLVGLIMGFVMSALGR